MNTNMPATNSDIEELNLRFTDGDSDLGIAPDGIFCKDMDEIIGRIEKVKDTVKKINLNNQHSLTEIPVILRECKLLEELDISHTEIKEIPDFLFTLPSLRSLSCCCWGLSYLPGSISKAEKLENLLININEDWLFPEEILSLPELKNLTIDFYSAVALPEKMGNLKKLECLSLSLYYEEGTAPIFPASFNKHPFLKKVSIYDLFYKSRKELDIDTAINILSSCPAFESLKLSGFAVGKAHQAISKLTGLKELEMRHLAVEGNIFDSIIALKNLEKLDIWGSEFRIAELPNIFDNYKGLRSFSFAGNIVCDIPQSIYGLTNLTTIEIGSTGISVLDEKIGNLKNLEKIHLYDNLLEKLPDSIFTLPKLSVLNIEENIFRQQEITSIKSKLNAMNKNDRKIEFMADGQGHRQFVKRLRTFKDTSAMETAVYARHCLNAVNENPHAIKYIDKNKLQGSRFYTELCIAAVRKTCFALEEVDTDILVKSHYYFICVEAARSPEVIHAFKFIKDDLLTDDEYTQLCIEAALHNNSAGFLGGINPQRMSREAYEHVCWVAVLHFPATISKMIEPTEELRKLVEERRQK